MANGFSCRAFSSIEQRLWSLMMSTLREQVIDVLRESACEGKKVTAGHIAKRCGVHRSEVLHVLDQLCAEKLCSRERVFNGSTLYRLNLWNYIQYSLGPCTVPPELRSDYQVTTEDVSST
jgi:hypothetical protein